MIRRLTLLTKLCFIITKNYFMSTRIWSIIQKRYHRINYSHHSHNPHHHDISYFHNNKKYIVRYKKRRGPCPFKYVLDDKGSDITEEILKYCGPHYDFHKIETTPGLLGYEMLNFYMASGQEKNFSKDEIIKV